MIIATFVYLPSLANLINRIILVIGIFALIFVIDRFHSKYLPFAAIYLSEKPTGLRALLAPAFVSWTLMATAGVVAILLGAYLQGYLSLSAAP